jgi:lipid II:glycine glycyltransferase (peptidoglycan interpeptide bridge formation enzyme)
MRRREQRGQAAFTTISIEPSLEFLRSGCGVLYQVAVEGSVLSSALVLISDRGAYYQSAGTSQEGMEHGASPYLVYETARSLQERGLQIFNLGGVAGTNPGLHDFKAGFGAAQRSLAATEYSLRMGLRGTLGSAIRRLRVMLPGSAR